MGDAWRDIYGWLVVNGLYRDVLAAVLGILIGRILTLRPLRRLIKAHQADQAKIIGLLDTKTPGGLGDVVATLQQAGTEAASAGVSVAGQEPAGGDADTDVDADGGDGGDGGDAPPRLHHGLIPTGTGHMPRLRIAFIRADTPRQDRHAGPDLPVTLCAHG